jgi:hypothetical protein
MELFTFSSRGGNRPTDQQTKHSLSHEGGGGGGGGGGNDD